MNKDIVKIADKFIGEGHPCFIIAELSANHLQNFELALNTVEAMKEAGADAVKLQTYTPDTLTLNCDGDDFQIKQGTVWDGTTLYKLYEKAYMPWEWQPKIKEFANSLGLVCFSSPFDISSVDFLEAMQVPAYKIASFEITDIPLIEYVASKNKPVIISTGVAELKDIEEALLACKRAGNEDVVLLKCTSSYPAPANEMNLASIADMKERFGCVAGLSDHSMGITAPIVAVSLGAKVIEKHFILDRNLGGADSGFSLEPHEFKAMVKAVREAEAMLGSIDYTLGEKSRQAKEFSRSLYAAEDIAEGEALTLQNVRSVRPAFGLPPKYLPEILGKKAAKEIKMGTPLSFLLINLS